MKLLVSFARVIYTIYAFLLFVIILLLISPLVIIGSFFGKIKGGNFIYRICGYWADTWLFMIGIRVRITYEWPHDKTKQYIFVANHISNMDVPMFAKVIRQPVRALGKSELAKIPVFGFLYRNTVVMVDRSNADNRARSVMVLKSVVRKGISIFIFPEGTFNETGKLLKDFYDGAFRIAVETGTPIKPVIFADTIDRLHHHSVFSLSPGKSRGIFLEEISVDGYSIKDVPALKQKVFTVMHNALKKYKAM